MEHWKNGRREENMERFILMDHLNDGTLDWRNTLSNEHLNYRESQKTWDLETFNRHLERMKGVSIKPNMWKISVIDASWILLNFLTEVQSLFLSPLIWSNYISVSLMFPGTPCNEFGQVFMMRSLRFSCLNDKNSQLPWAKIFNNYL